MQESVSMLEAKKIAHFLGLVECKEHALGKKIERDVLRTAVGVYGHLLKHHSVDGSVANEHGTETEMAEQLAREEEDEDDDDDDDDEEEEEEEEEDPVTDDAVAGGFHAVRHAATVVTMIIIIIIIIIIIHNNHNNHNLNHKNNHKNISCIITFRQRKERHVEKVEAAGGAQVGADGKATDES
jgi:hypothetical protein